MRLTVSRILLLACALFAVVPATAGAASAPKVTKVAPLKLKIGDRLTIRGKGFIAGKNRNTVVFKASGARAVFAKAETATKTKLVVKVPAKLAPFLTVKSGQATATRFQLRVLAKKLSASYTPKGKSPVIAPAVTAGAAAPVAKTPAAAAAAAPAPAAAAAAVAAPADCDRDGNPDASDPDDDNDLLPDAKETTAHTDRCAADSDNDGVSDVYEYESALDLNGRSLSYPAGAAFPNPNDGSDAWADFDGDGLTLGEEYTLWKRSGGTIPLSYSDGDQDSTATSDPAEETPSALSPALDRDGNHHLTDDEKDIDVDGLTNWEERHGPMLISWWASTYTSEKPFAFQPGAAPLYETNWLVGDTDIDGRADGLDDQDHDGLTNIQELNRDGGLWVNPYNPCLPNPTASFCTLHRPFTNAWAPFDDHGDLKATFVYDGANLVFPQP
jgi:hypothetical protein